MGENMKAAVYCRLIRPDPLVPCPISENHIQLIRMIEKESIDLFAVYVDEMQPGEENRISLHRCLRDFQTGLFQMIIVL